MEIDYIEATDVNGNIQKIRSVKETLPELKPGWKYPMTIRMDGIVPTVYPHEIEPWGEPTKIEVDKLPGIYTPDDFEKWLALYLSLIHISLTAVNEPTTGEELKTLRETLNGKAKRIPIQEVDEDKYGNVYYIYWNRHNDNEQNTKMGIMEFAVVRNNIYKLSVSKISELGHPNDPTNPTDPQEPDPDPVNPPKPDEQNKAYMEVDVQILDWTVRVNDIEF